jgi:hypothetical protein
MSDPVGHQINRFCRHQCHQYRMRALEMLRVCGLLAGLAGYAAIFAGTKAPDLLTGLSMITFCCSSCHQCACPRTCSGGRFAARVFENGTGDKADLVALTHSTGDTGRAGTALPALDQRVVWRGTTQDARPGRRFLGTLAKETARIAALLRQKT